MKKRTAVEALRNALTLVKRVAEDFKMREIEDARIALGESIDELLSQADTDYRRGSKTYGKDGVRYE
jgi:hypothetical protein